MTGGNMLVGHDNDDNDEGEESAYLIFVLFFTLTHFEAWKFYTQKCVNLRHKLPWDKIALIVCKTTHCV